MATLLVKGKRGIKEELILEIYSKAKELLNKTVKGCQRMIRIKFSEVVKYNKIYKKSNVGRMREAGFYFLMIQFDNLSICGKKINGIHFHVFNGMGGRDSKNKERKASPVDFFLTKNGEIFLADTKGEYSAEESKSIVNSENFFGGILEEIKKCHNGLKFVGVVKLF